jgi:hypothetical protein
MELPERQARLAFDARAGDERTATDPRAGQVPKSGENGDEGSGEGKVEHRRERWSRASLAISPTSFAATVMVAVPSAAPPTGAAPPTDAAPPTGAGAPTGTVALLRVRRRGHDM